MFGKRKETPKNESVELVGQEVAEDALDQFEQPTSQELDDIDLALESATLRDDDTQTKSKQDAALSSN